MRVYCNVGYYKFDCRGDNIMPFCKETMECTATSCLTTQLDLIQELYALAEDTIDGHLVSRVLETNRSMELTYNHGDTYIVLHAAPALSPGFGLGFHRDSETMTIRLDRYAKLISLRDEIDEALWKCRQPGYNETYSKHLGSHLFVMIFPAKAAVEIRQYITRYDPLGNINRGLELSHEEWVFLNTSYRKICYAVPPVEEMRRCIDTHTQSDGSLLCQKKEPRKKKEEKMRRAEECDGGSS
jgi:hypothetical protein